jgi:hypothetical protein
VLDFNDLIARVRDKVAAAECRWAGLTCEIAHLGLGARAPADLGPHCCVDEAHAVAQLRARAEHDEEEEEDGEGGGGGGAAAWRKRGAWRRRGGLFAGWQGAVLATAAAAALVAAGYVLGARARARAYFLS